MSNCYFIRTLEKSISLFWANYHEPHNRSDNKCEKYSWEMIIETWLSLLRFSLNSRSLNILVDILSTELLTDGIKNAENIT